MMITSVPLQRIGRAVAIVLMMTAIVLRGFVGMAMPMGPDHAAMPDCGMAMTGASDEGTPASDDPSPNFKKLSGCDVAGCCALATLSLKAAPAFLPTAQSACSWPRHLAGHIPDGPNRPPDFVA